MDYEGDNWSFAICIESVPPSQPRLQSPVLAPSQFRSQVVVRHAEMNASIHRLIDSPDSPTHFPNWEVDSEPW